MLGLVFALPFILVLVVFALSNAGTVTLGFWPTDYSVVLPLSLAVLGGCAIFFLLGGFVVFIGSLGHRRRARRAQSRVRALEREIAELRARPPAPPVAVPAGTPGTALRPVES